jgi:hypothetical protein
MDHSSAEDDHHTVAFHATDDDLVHRLAESVADGLASGDGVVLVATADHCARVAAELGEDMDLDRFIQAGSYRDVDAPSTLGALRTDAGIDVEAFERLIGSVVATAGAGGLRVRVVGELVGLMWDQGDVVGALALESHWNELIDGTEHILQCSYPADCGVDDLGPLCGICACHSSVADSDELVESVADDGATRSHVYVPHRGAPVQARRQVEQALLDWDCHDIVPDAVLLASEIATNSVVHARTPFRLTIARVPGAVRIAVTDGAPAMPVRRFPAADEPGGRGMALVEMLAVASGAEAIDGGKVVWAELAI